MRWIEIAITCPAETEEAVNYALLQVGCGGTQIEEVEEGVRLIRGFLPLNDALTPRLDALQQHLQRFPEFGLPPLCQPIALHPIDEADWEEAWKLHFKPMRIGNRLVITPPWEAFDATPDEIVILLEPGMAFGTGSHPTTRLCLQALETYLQPGMRVADIGTGSGILAIAAGKLGAAQVFATDIDSLPRQIAAENVARNGLETVITIHPVPQFYEVAHHCHLVVANIVANTIIEIAPDVARICAPEALFITSGIVEEHENLVGEALEAAGFTVFDTRHEEVWVCLVARYTARPSDEATLQRIAKILPPLAEL
ncbi:50S ribosomal protein L11 methyltransferase [Chthonomonas calidirosea]|uniref:Ribosomal protein L11 methyltransferase n=1 Tax=Chthonomonas calidirosea (strain DSM 23976 / ICMP 18418 / T49) TaxID=1303518 RepID=S0EYI9_CHTCT|nr:50S ribosomal protein L11 methyltransferase [Chthonomonas calidirosea]CCW34953.1 ribosomal protein L11 methyltransferase [Chthonomonas calidirosea T49]CEK12439.1 ribosomal protein L11 methyltransferase [Chthonomonas calidirosea]CEK13316.1 ribosomal protein L11 methyltransferase [Chthonomonas calidirosea]